MTISDALPRASAGTRRLPDRRWALVAVALGTFMTYLDNNIVNVAIPTIQRQLHLSEAGIEWVVSAYILLFAGLLLAGGRLADVFGAKRLFGMGLTVFTAASLLAGLAGSSEVLIASRAVQGLGAAMLTPTTLAIITRLYPEPREQAGAVGAWSAVGALALAVGPLVGGLLTEDASWHWIFFLNLPIGALTLPLAAWAIPTLAPEERRQVDFPGVGLSALALVSLTYGLIEGPRDGWGAAVIVGSFAVAALAAMAFVLAERRAADPMIDLSLFTSRSFRGGLAALMMWAFGIFGIYFFTSLYLQDVLRFSAIKAAVAFVPMALLMATGAALSDKVADRVGAHRSVGGGLALMAAGIVAVSLLGAGATFLDLMPGFAILGVGAGLTIPLTTVIIGGMPPERAGVASAVFNASREVAGLLGVTVIGVVITARQHAEIRAGKAPLVAFLSGYRLGLVVSAALCLAGAAAAWTSLRQAEHSGVALASAVPAAADPQPVLVTAEP